MSTEAQMREQFEKWCAATLDPATSDLSRVFLWAAKRVILLMADKLEAHGEVFNEAEFDAAIKPSLDAVGVVERAAKALEKHMREVGLDDTHTFYHAAQAALNTLQPPSDASGWRDIASAPKDGTAILLWQHEMTAEIGTYVSQNRIDEELVRETKAGLRTYRDKVVDTSYWSSENIYDPTHWQPLPAAPTKKAGD